jgi:HD-GYP domain-containing protein (c-di-GMP phosphodiesterase class II)
VSAALDPPSIPARAAVDLDPELDALITASRGWLRRALVTRDRLPALFSAAAFLGATGVLALVANSERDPSLATYLALIGAYAAASRVEFEVGAVYALPTQLVLVPMLFVLPLGFVPLCVAAALLAGDLAASVRSRGVNLERVPLRLANSWFAVGPVVVLAAFDAREPRFEHWPAFAAALGAQFVFDFGSTALLERLRVGLSPRKLVRFAAYAYLVDAALAPIGLLVAVVAVRDPGAALLVIPLLGLLGFFARERRARIDHALELSHAYRGTAFLLGDVVEADDAYTGSHSRDVVRLTLAVAERFGLDARERRNAEFVALLHDVGKVRLPAEVINKAGPLDDAERVLMRMHTIEGERMLEQVGGLLGEIGRLVRSCHEHWDGSGYHDGVMGERIPLVARIVCVCDAYSAMTTNRAYRAAMSPAAALEELRRCAGTQFDPQVVETLAAVAADAPRV